MNLSAPPIQRSKSLHQQTYEALRSSILSGRLAPGDRLVETQLAQQLQVSRTPIREAMRQLQREGLVKADGSGGLRVTAISVLDAMQLYDCRLALEELSVVEACKHATQNQIDRLAYYVTEAEDLLTLKNTQSLSSEAQTDQLLDLDYHFHRLIAEGANNPWLVFLLDQVFDKMALLRMETTRHDPGVLEVRLEHRQIYQAIAQRDRSAAAEAIQSHLTASKVRVIQSIKDLHPEAEPPP
ncbi:GntR family transcriptional regulator [Leptolyngbya ohadii]|uniref:GntR family transcriptional regulator n=1 Tax=Leptolyngbya ohadii TaxID=1962290 RepID=UPI000B598D0E|nr:GntR family transcriptional regulator [Leptolyngbya ohadii]